MNPLNSCARCSLPLPADSGDRLCPVCRAASDTGRPAATPNSAVGRTQTYPASGGRAEADTGRFAIDPRAGFPQTPAGYVLVRRLGGGGMGDVYLARDRAAERAVAMKFLRNSGNHVAVDRFLAEVRALAKVDHPHIVKILAADFDRAAPFFTMDHVPGGSLAHRVVENGPLAPAEAVRVVGLVARAVQAAHAAGVLHRDLKPSNILLAADGSPRVSDFGLAKRTDRDDGLSLGSGPIGTPGFMPPEQVSSRYGAVGPASDVYGLGATLYYLVTGRPPFTGETPADVVARVETSPPERPRAVCADIPPGLEAVVVKCLEKRPADRYATAAELADELEKCLAGGQKAPELTRWRRLRRWAAHSRRQLAAAGVATVLAVGLVVAGVVIGPPPRRIVAARPPTPPPVTLLPATPVLEFRPEVTHEDVQNDLRNRKTVALVTDVPRVPLAWGLGGCPIVEPERTGTRFSLKSRGLTAIHLLPNPGIDRYRVRAELRQERKPSAASKGPDFGLVVGHARVKAGPPGSVYHALMVVGIREFTDAGRVRLGLCAISCGLFEQPLLPPEGVRHRRGEPIFLDDLPAGDPPWWPLDVEVGPEGITVRHGGRTATYTAADINSWLVADLERQRQFLPPAAADLRLPTWAPRLPLGIWAEGCWLSVRNVTVEPRP